MRTASLPWSPSLWQYEDGDGDCGGVDGGGVDNSSVGGSDYDGLDGGSGSGKQGNYSLRRPPKLIIPQALFEKICVEIPV